MKSFPRIERLPPYVFNITAELKMAARRRGEDIIDMSMGNPDGATPAHIVEKMVEATVRPTTHGYSVSKGIPRLRKAITDWYQRRYNVDLDPDEAYAVGKAIARQVTLNGVTPQRIMFNALDPSTPEGADFHDDWKREIQVTIDELMTQYGFMRQG